MGSWWKPWQWSQDSNRAAVVNARAASTELSRRRVERQEIELFLQQHRRFPGGGVLRNQASSLTVPRVRRVAGG